MPREGIICSKTSSHPCQIFIRRGSETCGRVQRKRTCLLQIQPWISRNGHKECIISISRGSRAREGQPEVCTRGRRRSDEHDVAKKSQKRSGISTERRGNV